MKKIIKQIKSLIKFFNSNKFKPKTKKELKNLINKEIKRHGYQCNLNHIDTSLITDMSSLFECSDFNGDISQWDTSNVKNMQYMFAYSIFKGNINSWNVNNVENMSYMFWNSQFKENIENWTPVKLEFAKEMFFNITNTTPYWYSINLNEIKEKFKHYKEKLELTKKLEQELVTQTINNKKLKV